MKIGFINAIFTNKLDSFPIGLVSLCTVLQSKGVSAQIVDFTKLDVNDIIPKKDLVITTSISAQKSSVLKDFKWLAFIQWQTLTIFQ